MSGTFKPQILIRHLRPSDDRSAFTCGNPDLDRYFQSYAGQNQFRHFIGVTYVAVDAEDHVYGFVSVATTSIMAADLGEATAKRLPGHPLPALRLTRLGVSGHAQGMGIGGELVNLVLDLALQQAKTAGCVGVVIDAKPDAVAFYTGLGFVSLAVIQGELGDRPAKTPLFLSLHEIPPRS